MAPRALAVALSVALASSCAEVAAVDDPRIKCERTLGAITVSSFRARARECPEDSAVATAAFAIDTLDRGFPGVVDALASFGVRLELGHTPPEPCTVFLLGPSNRMIERDVKRHRHREPPITRATLRTRQGGAMDEEGASEIARGAVADLGHGDKWGLYCPVQRVAWADPDFPAAMISELFHAADQIALTRSKLQPYQKMRDLLTSMYGEQATEHYGFSKTSIDPKFYALWSDYGKRVASAPELHLGEQGIEQPIELFMELGEYYFDLNLLNDRERLAESGHGMPTPESFMIHVANRRADLAAMHPRLLAYFKETMASIVKRSKRKWLLDQLAKIPRVVFK